MVKKQSIIVAMATLAVGFMLLPDKLWAEDANIEPITVTATRMERPVADAPGAITIISREDLAALPDGDLFEAIRETTGISLVGIGIGGRKSISIRGMEARHSLILVDGKRVASTVTVFGHSNFENNWLTSDNIERIEIVRGPLSALYGSEAIGGVINIITRGHSKQEWSFGGTVGGGFTDDDGGNSSYIRSYISGPVVRSRVGLYLAAGYSTQDDTPDEDNSARSELEGVDAFSLNSRLTFAPNDNHTINLAVNYVNEDRWRHGLTRTGRGRPPAAPFIGVFEIDRHMYSLAWAGVAGPTRSTIKLYRSEVEKNSIQPRGTQNIVADYPETLTNDVLDLQTNFAFGRHLLTLGGEWRKENLESTTLLTGEDDAIHKAFFVQNELEFFDKLSLTIGGRLDHHDQFGSEFSPRIYGLLQMTELLNIKAGFGRAFNAPTLKQVSAGYHASFGPHTFLGNPNVAPETSKNYELGVEYNTPTFWAKAFYFHNDIDNLIAWHTLSRVGHRRTMESRNIEEARTRGIETELGVTLQSGINASLNYHYLDARNQTADIRLDGRPRHTVNAKLQYHIQQFGITTTLRAQFIADQVMWNDDRPALLVDAPDYSLWHFSARKFLSENFELKVGVENIGDYRLADDSDLFAYEEQGRFFYTSLTAKF